MCCSEKTAIFDMDGTLFQSETVALPAFRRAFMRLREEGLYRGDPPSDGEIQSVFGMTQEEIWSRLLPEADEGARKRADRWTLEEELAGLRRGEGRLYPGVAETLRRLKAEGWRLFIASNGLRSYLDGVLETFRLSPLFTGVYGAGDHGTETKEELVRMLMEEHGVTGGFMVGDRKSDVRAGKANGLKVIGCRYPGFTRFGREDELKDADVVVDRFPDILPVLLNRCGDPS
ncbi:MAG: HAD family hydrolase [Bacillota bacterium]